MDIFIPLLLMFSLVLGLLIVMLAMNRLLAPHNPNPIKNQTFECGNIPKKLPEGRSFVRFYLIAILFILFDLEIAFLFPWATIFKDIVASESIKLFGFIEMLVFVAILVVGYVYAWAKGALEWE